jgi:hypothetical protein
MWSKQTQKPKQLDISVCTNHRIVHLMALMVKPPKILKQIGLKHVYDTYQ